VSITTDLDAIRARVDVATAGPWNVDNTLDELDIFGEVRWFEDHGHRVYGAPWIARLSDGHATQADAKFIAHARTDVPFLLDLVDELRRQVKVWKGKAE
jgi:hypothetical protein